MHLTMQIVYTYESESHTADFDYSRIKVSN